MSAPPTHCQPMCVDAFATCFGLAVTFGPATAIILVGFGQLIWEAMK